MVAQQELEDASPDEHRAPSHGKRNGKMFVKVFVKMFVACCKADPQIVHTTHARAL